jgi:competence protein ComEC
MDKHRYLSLISLLGAVSWVGGTNLPHHDGKSANPLLLYNWARPRTVVVSQRMPAPGMNDALSPLERSGTPLLRTWQRGAVHFEWRPNHIITEGFLDQYGQPRS